MPDGKSKLAQPGAKKLGDWRTDYRINKDEADTIRRIFKMYGDGWGLGAIAKTLNQDSLYPAENRKFFAGERRSAPRNPSQNAGTGRLLSQEAIKVGVPTGNRIFHG